MENCKYCQAALEENSTVCPACGKDNAVQEAAAEEETVQAAEPAEAPAPAEEEKKPAPKHDPVKTAFAVIVVVLLLAILIAVIVSGQKEKAPETAEETEAAQTEEMEETVPATVPEDGNPDDVTCKGTYSAEDAALAPVRDVVVARAGDRELTLSQLQVFYWMEVRNFMNNYGSYAAYFGLDIDQPLDTQVCGISEENRTWQQYFLEVCLDTWLNYQAMAAEAETAEFEMPADVAEILANLEEDLEQSAVDNGYANADDLIGKSLGASVDMADYVHFMNLYYQGYGYFSAMTSDAEATEEELEAFFDSHAEEYAEGGLTKESVSVDVRHILVYPEGADSSSVRSEEFSEEAWAAGEAKAQEILDAWLAGEATEDSFAALAGEYSGDPGSSANGGLYTGVTEGQMVQNFNDWCFDAQRQVGDYGIVRTEFGFHIMYFSGSKLLWKEYALSGYRSELGARLVEESAAKYPLSVDYSAILLGHVVFE